MSFVVLMKAPKRPSRPALESCSCSVGGRKTKVWCKTFLTHRQPPSHSTAPPPRDISDSYSKIEKLPQSIFPEGGFGSNVRHDTGVTLSAGESLQADGTIVVSHAIPDFFNDAHRPVLIQPGQAASFSCRITASA
jgi:hypothetical protein